MELMIRATLVLPDTVQTLADLEAIVVEWGRDLMQRGLAAAWAAQASLRPTPSCPVCGGASTRPAGVKPRKVEASFGPVWLPRQRVRCAACARHFQPDDVALAPVLGAGRLSPRLRDLAVLCGASWPYRQAAAVLGKLRGVPLSHEAIRTVVDEVGTRVAAAQAAEGAAACAPPSRSVAAERPVPAQVTVEVDGAWIASHDNPEGGMEVKVGVVHTGSEPIGRDRRRLVQRRYVATAQGAAAFQPLLTAAIDHHHGFACPTQTVLGDGAGWIWRLREEALPAATPVLDRWHLRQARRRALRAALPDKEERAAWSEQLEAVLDVGDVPGALKALTEVAAMAPHPALEEFAGYLTALTPAIPDYAARRAAGERIGSGGVEKGVDLVANRRLKGKRGMRWWRVRVEGVVALRVAMLNGDWDTLVGPALTTPKTTG